MMRPYQKYDSNALTVSLSPESAHGSHHILFGAFELSSFTFSESHGSAVLEVHCKCQCISNYCSSRKNHPPYSPHWAALFLLVFALEKSEVESGENSLMKI
ncbi:uncharacterized protein [Drosophila bipectinata]|uniref:uncharacterized protein n=1 Tax=Drosophila bipectinata TaxID=42026 RepID=UPI0038B23552